MSNHSRKTKQNKTKQNKTQQKAVYTSSDVLQTMFTMFLMFSMFVALGMNPSSTNQLSHAIELETLQRKFISCQNSISFVGEVLKISPN